MNRMATRLVLMTVSCASMLAACSAHSPAKGGTPGSRAANGSPGTTVPLTTGIAICDSYLSSYKSCHTTAGTYPPDSLDMHYQAMRLTLLRESQATDLRAQLVARCNNLTVQLHQSLRGKSCGDAPAPASGN